ncbi:aldo/keto reductase [Lactiplantibacillus xiangfangensis]|uniref:Aryl-alcohol dehydrogenase family enzyme n=1 Tax=Lactiplantibacillus xiangfangensis TaxID=942150 RepID=A0A0R2MBN9_9LACO|nr:aldo/keto reductase [Lactiplantibacillus xiangfangensis]KRO10855.1 Aryl-alcohol dehydrogenase family enzyme [Lactiplantibacillus xiangfangensis]
MTYSAASTRYDELPIRRVGRTGLQLPIVSLGLWRNFGDEQPYANSRKVVLDAFDHGVFSFDLANNYGPSKGSAEQTFGKIFQDDLKPYRDELVITTKAGYPAWPGPYGAFGSRKTLISSLDRSLKRMHLDYVDLYYSHRPDPDIDLQETAQALDQVVRQGKAMYVGISNYDRDQTAEMIGYFKDMHTPFTVNQFSYNMLHETAQTTGLIDLLAQNGAGLVAYGPLAEGLLTQRYLDGIPADFPIHRTNKYLLANGTDAVVKRLNDLNAVAQHRGQTLAQMALAWLLRSEAVTSVIIGTTSIAHLHANLDAAKQLMFSDEEVATIKQILKK